MSIIIPGQDNLEMNQDELAPTYIQNGNGMAQGESSSSSSVMIHYIDITLPLSNLKAILEQKLNMPLTDYVFYLQDTQQLEDSKNLVEQCVQGEGMVQVNVEIFKDNDIKKINIVDVLKPSEEMSDFLSNSLAANSSMSLNMENEDSNKERPVARWSPSSTFKQLQVTHQIPQDPAEWNLEHVDLWITWALQHFGLPSSLGGWELDGPQLLNLTQTEFTRRVPYDPNNHLWTHLELLRKYKIIAIPMNVSSPASPSNPNLNPNLTVQQIPSVALAAVAPNNKRVMKPQKPVGGGGTTSRNNSSEGTPGNRTGNNGQYQLWQFLLELLTDKDQTQFIQWLGAEGEFKLLEPEVVAQMWGQRKNKPNMNYEKLSRALRYYYDGDMIAKVHGKRFVYKFVCDLKSMLGYNAAELEKLVSDCKRRKHAR